MVSVKSPSVRNVHAITNPIMSSKPNVSFNLTHSGSSHNGSGKDYAEDFFSGSDIPNEIP